MNNDAILNLGPVFGVQARDGRWSAVQAGENHTVPKGVVHAWRNASQSPVRFLNVHRPAMKFEDYF